MSIPNLYPESQYYLHTNGEVIYKPRGGVEVEAGGFVKRVWNANFLAEGPVPYCDWLKELVDLGANKTRVLELGNIQHLDNYITDWKKVVGLE